MSIPTRGLGRGLDALFQGTDAPEMAEVKGSTADAPQGLPISAVRPNPNQPRRVFVDAQLEELAESIKRQGVLQPILVRPLAAGDGYEIVAGERRWRAASKAGLQTIPAVVRDMNDQEVLVVGLMENLQREDLNPVEEALGLQQLKEEFGFSQEEMAYRLGKSRSAIANTLRLLGLNEAAREDLLHNRMTAGHARALLVITDPDCQDQVRRYLLSSGCTVREAESIAAIWKETGSLPELDAATINKPPVQRKVQASLDAALSGLQDSLRKELGVPVVIRGKETGGKIQLSYGSRQQLEEIAAKLGCNEF